MKNKKIISLIIVFFSISICLLGCGKLPGGKDTPDLKIDNEQTKQQMMEKEQYLNLFIGDNIDTLDISKSSDAYSSQIIMETNEGLTRWSVKAGKDQLEAAGAKSWEVSDDNRIWTFYLRDQKWSDGQPVTAKQYVDSWIRLLDHDTGADASLIHIIKGAEEFSSGKGKKEDVGVEAVNDKVLKIILKEPAPYFVQLTAQSKLYPIRIDKVEQAGEDYGKDIDKLVYNGPFVIKEWVKDSHITLKKNDDYWDKKNVKLNEVNFQMIEKEPEKMRMFENKELDVVEATRAHKDRYKVMSQNGDMGYRSVYTPEYDYEVFNCKDKNKLFTNSKIRLAFSLAMDRNGLTDIVFDKNHPAYGMVPFKISSEKVQYREMIQEPLKLIRDDPKTLFKQGLSELGLDSEARYTVSYLVVGTDDFIRTRAEFMQDQWQKALDVDVKLDFVSDYQQFDSKLKSGDFQITGITKDSVYNDPMVFFEEFTSDNPNNYGNYSSKEFDDAINRVKHEKDYSKRLKLYADAERIVLCKDAAIAPAVYKARNIFIHNYVENLMTPMFGPYYEFKYVHIDGR